MTNLSAGTRVASLKTLTAIIYALYAVSMFTGLTGLVALIMNYVKREDTRGTWLESHFRWQIRTFWFALVWGILGGATAFIGIGFAILAADGIWIIYRLVKGALALYDCKPMYAD